MGTPGFPGPWPLRRPPRPGPGPQPPFLPLAGLGLLSPRLPLRPTLNPPHKAPSSLKPAWMPSSSRKPPGPHDPRWRGPAQDTTLRATDSGFVCPPPSPPSREPGSHSQWGPRTLSPRPSLPAKTAPPLTQQGGGQPGLLRPRAPSLLALLLPKPHCWLLQLSVPTLLKSLPPAPHPACLLRAPAACLASPRGIYRHLKLSPKNRSSLPKPAAPIFPSVRCRHLRPVFSGARPLLPAPPASPHSPKRDLPPRENRRVFSLTSGPCRARSGHMLTSSPGSQGVPSPQLSPGKWRQTASMGSVSKDCPTLLF